MKHLQALIFSFSLYFLELMKEVGQYLQKYQIDSDDDNITYHPLLCSSFYQNSLKKLFDVFYSPPFTTVPSPVPLLLFSHEVTPTRPPPRPRQLPHQSRAPSDQVLILISDLSGAVTSDWTSPLKILSPSDSQNSALPGVLPHLAALPGTSLLIPSYLPHLQGVSL